MSIAPKELLARGIGSGVAWKVAGVTQREGDYWATTGLVKPSVVVAEGKGTGRVYAMRDVIAMRTVKALREAGLSLQKVRKALKEIGRRWPEIEAPLSSTVLVTDGRDLLRVLPEDEARDTLMSLVIKPGELAWRRIVVPMGEIAREVREAVERERAKAA